jgi:hypothetical protein
MGARVEEERESKGRPVMGRIGVEPSGDITPRESEQTSLWSFLTRKLGKPPKETKRMTAVETQAGAVSHEPTDWRAIDWRKVHQNARRLQARIVKATREGGRGKVKALQRLLTHSFSGKALGVRRVTENQGKKTPGVDRVVWDASEKKAKAVDEPRQRGYQALPRRRVNIPKSNGKTRPLGILRMKDRAMRALYLLALDPIAETTADRNSRGFRLERSTADAIEQCRLALSKGSVGAVCARGRHQGVLRRNFPRLARGPYPHGEGHAPEAAQGRVHREGRLPPHGSRTAPGRRERRPCWPTLL